MASSPDAVAYVYDNIGFEANTSSADGIAYVDENIGFEPNTYTPSGIAYVYEEVVPHQLFPQATLLAFRR